MINWVVYILECSDSSFYIGITNDLERRIKTHNNGKGAKYTKSRSPVSLICYWGVSDRSEASKWEYKLKKLKRKQKESLIQQRVDSIIESYKNLKKYKRK